MLQLLDKISDATIEELRHVLGERGHSFGYGTLRCFFKRHRITRNKRQPTSSSRTAPRPDAPSGLVRSPAGPGPTRLVFIDETWASTNMARTHGRALRGQCQRAGIPHGHWKTATFVAGLCTGGMVVPMVLDGPIYGKLFEVYVDRYWRPNSIPATSW